jgi:hypothetical protein
MPRTHLFQRRPGGGEIYEETRREEKLMENEKPLVDKSRMEILKQMIDGYKSSEDKFVRGMGEGMEIALEFLMGAKS